MMFNNCFKRFLIYPIGIGNMYLPGCLHPDFEKEKSEQHKNVATTELAQNCS